MWWMWVWNRETNSNATDANEILKFTANLVSVACWRIGELPFFIFLLLLVFFFFCLYYGRCDKKQWKDRYELKRLIPIHGASSPSLSFEFFFYPSMRWLLLLVLCVGRSYRNGIKCNAKMKWDVSQCGMSETKSTALRKKMNGNPHVYIDNRNLKGTENENKKKKKRSSIQISNTKLNFGEIHLSCYRLCKYCNGKNRKKNRASGCWFNFIFSESFFSTFFFVVVRYRVRYLGQTTFENWTLPTPIEVELNILKAWFFLRFLALPLTPSVTM